MIQDIEFMRFRSLVSRGLTTGKLQCRGVSYEWNASGRCEAPLRRQLRSSKPPSIMAATYEASYLTTRFIDLIVRCRKCEACLRSKRNLWTTRAYREVELHPRTWFVTLTFNAHHRFRVHVLARRKYQREDYRALSATVSKLFTKYMKRLRKQSGANVRYLLAIEPHKDGFPHLHMLLHEATEGQTSKRMIEVAWPYGFTNVKLADADSSRYVCKYLSKTEQARVRASLRYGQDVLAT